MCPSVRPSMRPFICTPLYSVLHVTLRPSVYSSSLRVPPYVPACVPLYVPPSALSCVPLCVPLCASPSAPSCIRSKYHCISLIMFLLVSLYVPPGTLRVSVRIYLYMSLRVSLCMFPCPSVCLSVFSCFPSLVYVSLYRLVGHCGSVDVGRLL